MSLGHLVTHTHQLSVNILEPGPRQVVDRPLQVLLHEPRRNWAEHLVERVVLRVPDAGLERWLGS